MRDIEQQVCEDIMSRQKVGVKKYGMTLALNPLTLRQWLVHNYEELLDAALYSKRAIEQMDFDSKVIAQIERERCIQELYDMAYSKETVTAQELKGIVECVNTLRAGRSSDYIDPRVQTKGKL